MNFKISKILILISFFATIISSCKKDNEQDNDSYESYSYELWKNLVDSNYNFDYVGRQKDYGNYEEYSGQEFDNDHEGAGGYESEDILVNIDEILKAISSPDIVLLSIGGNDLLDGGNPPSEPIANIVELVEKLQAHNSNITIFLERIAPANSETMTSSLTNKLNDFNLKLSLLQII